MAAGAAKKAKSLTQPALFKLLAEKSGLTQTQVAGVWSALREVAQKELKGAAKQIKLPGLVTLKNVRRPARPAATRSMFGKMVQVPAKPASQTVRAYVRKDLKEAV